MKLKNKIRIDQKFVLYSCYDCCKQDQRLATIKKGNEIEKKLNFSLFA